MERNLHTVRSLMFIPTACRSPPITGSVAGAISCSFDNVISAIPVPKIAEFNTHSAIDFLTLFLVKSSYSFSLSKTISLFS